MSTELSNSYFGQWTVTSNLVGWNPVTAAVNRLVRRPRESISFRHASRDKGAHGWKILKQVLLGNKPITSAPLHCFIDWYRHSRHSTNYLKPSLSRCLLPTSYLRAHSRRFHRMAPANCRVRHARREGILHTVPDCNSVHIRDTDMADLT